MTDRVNSHQEIYQEMDVSQRLQKPDLHAYSLGLPELFRCVTYASNSPVERKSQGI